MKGNLSWDTHVAYNMPSVYNTHSSFEVWGRRHTGILITQQVQFICPFIFSWTYVGGLMSSFLFSLVWKINVCLLLWLWLDNLSKAVYIVEICMLSWDPSSTTSSHVPHTPHRWSITATATATLSFTKVLMS